MTLTAYMKIKFQFAIFMMKLQGKKTYKIDENWQMYLTDSNHYYAVQTDAARTITANTACIRKAYRIDPNTGNSLSQTLRDVGHEEHFLFAVKRFDSPRRLEEAKIEAETLQQHQFAEPLLIDDSGCPIVISVYYPGLPLTQLETAQTQDIVKTLSFFQRIDLCYQLSKQYYHLHHHPDGAKLHIDVKGQNTIIYQGPSDERWRARLIDFGSVKRVEDATNPIPTTISGMTEYALAPEVISKPVEKNQPTWKMNLDSGSVSEKSDIYAFSAIVMSLLGASDPYQYRHVQQNATLNTCGLYDIQTLKTAVTNDFSTTDIFNIHERKKLNYHFSGESCCKFFKQEGLALTPKKVLETYATHQPCYIAYDNHLLYLEGNQVSGYARPLRLKTLDIDNDKILTTDELARLDILSGYTRRHSGEPLQIRLQTAISSFLSSMTEPDPIQRPSSEEVYTFFKTVYAMCHLSEYHFDIFDEQQTIKNPQMLERQLQIMQVQLEFITLGIPVPQEYMKGMLEQTNFPELLLRLNQYIRALEEFLANPDESGALPAPPWHASLTEHSIFTAATPENTLATPKPNC